MWEESPVGDWTLEIKNDGRQRVDLTNWSISFYGTKEHPGPGAPSPDAIGTNPIVNSNAPDIAPAATEVDLNQVPEDPEKVPVAKALAIMMDRNYTVSKYEDYRHDVNKAAGCKIVPRLVINSYLH